MDPRLTEAALRIADALERLAPPRPAALDLAAADAFVWQPERKHLHPVATVSRVAIGLLQGIDRLTQPGMLLAPSDRWKRECCSIKRQIINKTQKFVVE